MWSYVYAKKRNLSQAKSLPLDAGAVWVWMARDWDSKFFVVCLLAIDRDADTATSLIRDLRLRIVEQSYLSTDGLVSNFDPVDHFFDTKIDYVWVTNVYRWFLVAEAERRYSAPKSVRITKRRITGSPGHDRGSHSTCRTPKPLNSHGTETVHKAN